MLMGGPPNGSPMGGFALPQGVPLVGAVGNVSAARVVTADPTVAGLAAGVGTYAVLNSGGTVWIKYGTADTEWWQVGDVGQSAVQPYARRWAEARAVAKLGTNQLTSYWQDFEEGVPASWEAQKPPGATAGAYNGGATAPLGGIVAAVTAATAGQTARLRVGDATNGHPLILPSGSANEWYFCGRLCLHNVHSSLRTDTGYYGGFSFYDADGVRCFFIGRTGAHGEQASRVYATDGTDFAYIDPPSGSETWVFWEAWRADSLTYVAVNQSDVWYTGTGVGSARPDPGGAGLAIEAVNGAQAQATGIMVDWVSICLPHASGRFGGLFT